MTDRFAPPPGSSVLLSLGKLTDRHEDAGDDPTLIAAMMAQYLRDYIDQRGVPLGVTLIPMKGKI